MKMNLKGKVRKFWDDCDDVIIDGACLFGVVGALLIGNYALTKRLGNLNAKTITDSIEYGKALAKDYYNTALMLDPDTVIKYAKANVEELKLPKWGWSDSDITKLGEDTLNAMKKYLAN